MQKIPCAADESGIEISTLGKRKSHQLLIQVLQGKLTTLYLLWVTPLRACNFFSFVLIFFSVIMIPR